MSALELKVPPALMTTLAGLLQWSLDRALPGMAVDIPAAGWIVAVSGALGVAFAVGGVLAFAAARTTVDPTRPSKTAAVVQNGVYQITRNPMYLGFLLFLLAFAVYLGNPLAFLVLPLFVLAMTRLQIVPEERALTEKFGEPYRQYLARVRRWI